MQCLYNTGIGRALEFRKDIDDFVARNRDLRAFELSEDEWAVIVQVCDWLGAFRAATTQMTSGRCHVYFFSTYLTFSYFSKKN